MKFTEKLLCKGSNWLHCPESPQKVHLCIMQWVQCYFGVAYPLGCSQSCSDIWCTTFWNFLGHLYLNYVQISPHSLYKANTANFCNFTTVKIYTSIYLKYQENIWDFILYLGQIAGPISAVKWKITMSSCQVKIMLWQ